MENINYINAVMNEINDFTDCIYEDLCDKNYNSLNKNIQELIKLLRDINKSHDQKQKEK
jgi:hypothetical protein